SGEFRVRLLREVVAVEDVALPVAANERHRAVIHRTAEHLPGLLAFVPHESRRLRDPEGSGAAFGWYGRFLIDRGGGLPLPRRCAPGRQREGQQLRLAFAGNAAVQTHPDAVSCLRRHLTALDGERQNGVATDATGNRAVQLRQLEEVRP